MLSISKSNTDPNPNPKCCRSAAWRVAHMTAHQLSKYLQSAATNRLTVCQSNY